MSDAQSVYERDVISWIKNIVIGLNFCPFARRPFESQQVSIICEEVSEEDAVLEVVLRELLRLEKTVADDLETTLIVLPKAYACFNEFNSLLFVLNEVLVLEGFEGIFQIASFHPKYQFADTEYDDVENFTNRSPYPIVHLIREESVSAALDSHPDPDAIPDNNINRLKLMPEEELKALFSYLFKKNI